MRWHEGILAVKSRKGVRITLYIVGSIVILAIVYSVLFGVQTRAVLSLKKPKSEFPELYMVPEDLQVRSELKFAGRVLSFFSYEFEAPWRHIEKEDIRESYARVSFRSGKGIRVFNPAKSVSLLETIQEDPGYADKIISWVGRENLKSNYALYRTILRATPDELSIFMSRRDANKLGFLLILKGFITPNAATGMYAFEYQDLRGFQFGSPARTNKVILHVFDKNDRMIDILIFVDNDSATLSQDEVTHVIKTLRPVKDGVR